jgi:hypothetical protein
MKRTLLVAIVLAFYVLHQDVWFWRTASPLVFGFIPVGLFYHACFTVAASLVMWMLVRHAWPSHLEEDIEQSLAARGDSLGRDSREGESS